MFKLILTRTFSLIELLVVIGTIAILMSILLPALKKARDTTYIAVCKSNLKQVGLLMNNYAIDNDGWLSGNSSGNGPQCLTLAWLGSGGTSYTLIRTNAYVTDGQWASTGQVFFCPSNLRSKAMSGPYYPYGGNYGYLKNGETTYIILNNFNNWGAASLGIGCDPGHWNGGRISQFNPRHSLIQDWVLQPSATSTQPDQYKSSHGGGGNVLFVDNSVKWYNNSDLTVVANANELDRNRVYILKPSAHTWPD